MKPKVLFLISIVFLFMLGYYFVYGGTTGDSCNYMTNGDSQCDTANNIYCVSYKCEKVSDTTTYCNDEDSANPSVKASLTFRYRDYDGRFNGGSVGEDCVEGSLIVTSCQANAPNGCYVREAICDSGSFGGYTFKNVRCDYGCSNGVCLQASAPQTSCTDNLKNQDETDVDCGGSCPKCQKGKACITSSDCSTTICKNNVCSESTGTTPQQTTQPEPTCNDGIKNRDEEDVDCGGAYCRICRTMPPTDSYTNCVFHCNKYYASDYEYYEQCMAKCEEIKPAIQDQTQTETQQPPEQQAAETSTTQCVLQLRQQTIVSGEEFGGRVRYTPNAVCDILGRVDSDDPWESIMVVRIEDSGYFNFNSAYISTVGTWTLQAVCGECKSNILYLEVTPIEDVEEGSFFRRISNFFTGIFGKKDVVETEIDDRGWTGDTSNSDYEEVGMVETPPPGMLRPNNLSVEIPCADCADWNRYYCRDEIKKFFGSCINTFENGMDAHNCKQSCEEVGKICVTAFNTYTDDKIEFSSMRQGGARLYSPIPYYTRGSTVSCDSPATYDTRYEYEPRLGRDEHYNYNSRICTCCG